MSDKLEHFYLRTNAHISRVSRNADVLVKAGVVSAELISQVAFHDASKFEEPEFSPYVEITWMYRCQREGHPYEMTDELKQRMAEATLHHIKANKHHPEYWTEDVALNLDDRDKPPGMLIDGTAMDNVSVAEMCCDWVAMSQEKLNSNSAHAWAKANSGIRWRFTDEQVTLIYKCLDALEAQ